jgi:hypothetical protein
MRRTNKHKQRKSDMSLQQTTEGKDELNTASMQKPQRTTQHGMANIKTHNTTTQKNWKQNVDIKINAHDAFLGQPLSGTLKTERFDSQIILQFLGTIKQKGLNRIVKIG